VAVTSYVVFERTESGQVDPLALVDARSPRQALRIAEERFPGKRVVRAREVHRVEAGDVLRAQYRGRVRLAGGNGRRAARGGVLGGVRRALSRARERIIGR
jgi:hypothetical protein